MSLYIEQVKTATNLIYIQFGKRILDDMDIFARIHFCLNRKESASGFVIFGKFCVYAINCLLTFW